MWIAINPETGVHRETVPPQNISYLKNQNLELFETTPAITLEYKLYPYPQNNKIKLQLVELSLKSLG